MGNDVNVRAPWYMLLMLQVYDYLGFLLVGGSDRTAMVT